MIDFIELFNEVVKVAKPSHAGHVYARHMSDRFADIGIDSLDAMVLIIYITDIYGVEESICKEWQPHSVQELHDLLMTYKTQEPESIADAMRICK